LANEFRDDREAYTNAKAGFVTDVLRQRGITISRNQCSFEV